MLSSFTFIVGLHLKPTHITTDSFIVTFTIVFACLVFGFQPSGPQLAHFLDQGLLGSFSYLQFFDLSSQIFASSFAFIFLFHQVSLEANQAIHLISFLIVWASPFSYTDHSTQSDSQFPDLDIFDLDPHQCKFPWNYWNQYCRYQSPTHHFLLHTEHLNFQIIGQAIFLNLFSYLFFCFLITIKFKKFIKNYL